MRVVFALVMFIASFACGSIARAADPSPSPTPSTTAAPTTAPSATERAIALGKARIDAMLRTGHADPAWFAASFLAAIPASQLDPVLKQVTDPLGAYAGVDFAQTKYVARFAKGTMDVLIVFDADAKITGLRFLPPVTTTSFDERLRALQPPRGRLSYVIETEGRSDGAALDASRSMAVGSAFKLAVLDALRDDVARGVRRWNDVVPLRAEWATLPSGVLRTWPVGTPLTIATYAAQMISISDNLAADALARLVGPAALRPYAGANAPFLTTREMFVLKGPSGAALRTAYLDAATAATRATVLRRVDALPLPDDVARTPILGIEWSYSVRDLCRMMSRVADLPIMSINPGAADAARFRRVAFKGGSDVGVLNLTTQVVTKRGTRICFSATVNDDTQPVDDAAFVAAYASVVNALADR